MPNAAEPEAGEKTTVPVGEQVEADPEVSDDEGEEGVVGAMRGELRKSQDRLETLEKRMPEVARRFEELLDEVGKIQPPEARDPPAPEPEPAGQLTFRPPLEKFTTKQALIFHCQEGGLCFVDLDEVNRCVHDAKQQRGRNAAKPKKFVFDLPESDAQCHVSLAGRLGHGLKSEVHITRRPGTTGESDDAIRQRRSRYRRTLAEHSPERCYASFGVWPDSFELFHVARKIAWEAGYEVGWVPLSVGETMSLGEGLGMTE